MTSGKQGGLCSVGDVSCESVLIVFVALFVVSRQVREASGCLPAAIVHWSPETVCIHFCYTQLPVSEVLGILRLLLESNS